MFTHLIHMPRGWPTWTPIVTTRYSHRVNEPGREYQRFLVQAINAERAAQGLTIKELARRAGIGERTMLRINGLERDLDFQQIEQIARALNVTVSALTLAAEARRAGTTTTKPLSHSPVDPRMLLQHLLDNPDEDTELLARLSEAREHVGDRSARAKRLADEIRHTRHGELTRALDSLPPQTERAAGN